MCPSSEFRSNLWMPRPFRFPTASAAGNSTFLSADDPTLLHFRTQSILSLLVEDSDANRCGKEVVHRWNYFHN